MFVNRLTNGTAILVVTTAFGIAPCVAADAPLVQGAPANNKGFETIKKQTVDLGSEIPGMESRQLRIRLLTIEPGGHIKVHSHKNRPAAFYVIQGATTIIYGDGTVKRFPAGTMGYANKNTVHWHRNNEKEPAVFVAADIFQSEKM
ncbi:MAG: cupin domain-containing protein [Gammaproteobacteria bacterium]|nr:MAG: cupin domain-containing protein [Gammaproteobacteria bacterium]